MPAKVFQAVNCCCNNECFREVNTAAQEEFLREFWSSGDYNSQNVLLKGLMTLKPSSLVQEQENKKMIIA